MATYTELFELRQDAGLLNKITTAIAIKSKNVIDGAGTAGQKDWAREAINNPSGVSEKVIWFMLVANKDNSIAQIQGANDSAVQANTDVAIDDLISGLV